MKTELAAAFYNAAGVPEENLPFGPRSEELFARVRPQCRDVLFPGARVLEIGCGNGRFCFALERMGAVPTGLDCAGELIAFARDYAARTGSRAAFVLGDAADMDFGAGEFDAVFLLGNNIAEFSLREFAAMTRSAGRILRPGGVFCLHMNDCVLHDNGKTLDAAAYDAPRGVLRSVYTTPRGPLGYDSYFWTVSMAEYILSDVFGRVTVRRTDEKRFWLEARSPAL